MNFVEDAESSSGVTPGHLNLRSQIASTSWCSCRLGACENSVGQSVGQNRKKREISKRRCTGWATGLQGVQQASHRMSETRGGTHTGADQPTAIDIASMGSSTAISQMCPGAHCDTGIEHAVKAIADSERNFCASSRAPLSTETECRGTFAVMLGREELPRPGTTQRVDSSDGQHLLMRGGICSVQASDVSHYVTKSRNTRSGCRFEMRHRQLPASVGVADNAR